MTARRLSEATVEWLNRVAEPGEPRDETIARLVVERDREETEQGRDDLLVRRDALLHLDDL